MSDRDDDLYEDEWSDEDDSDDGIDEDPDEMPCPACGRMVYEDAPKCPHCGEWITAATAAERRSRTWLWPLLVAGLISLILVAWHGLGR
jgi:uncharacterized paraquat-inducible protein A